MSQISVRQALAQPSAAFAKAGTQVQTEGRLGLPTFFWAAESSNKQPAAAAKGQGSEEASARGHLDRYAALYRIDPKELRSIQLQSIHNTGDGPVIVKFRSTVEGVDVFREQVAVSMDQQFNLIAVSGFVTGTASGVNRTFALTSSQAIARAISDLLDIQVSDASLVRSGGQGPYEHYSAAPGVSAFHFVDQARAKKVFYRLPGRLDAAYYVEVSLARPGDHDSKAYGYVISAADGKMLFRMNQTASDNFGYRVWADASAGGLRLPFDGPQGNSPTPKANPVPDGNVPPFIAPNFLTLQSGPISTGDPWLAPGATFTLGNNVEAFADLASPDNYQPGTADTYAYTTSAGNFDHLYDLNMAAGSTAEQTQAGVTQLFYNVNMFHDWYYDAGFKEVDGNAQKSNYGRGGLENDSIFAEDLDFAGRNNANMATPADGARPRMRMYVWDGPQTSTISATGGVTGSFPNGTADFGPSNFNVTAPLLRTNPIDACNPVTNNLTGKIAFVDRGTCSFVIKTKNAQLAGASAVIIANVASSTNPEIPPGMTGVDATVTIGTLSLALTDGNTFRTALDNSIAVTATLNRVTGLSRDGALDNQIVAHEWGHYISNRLVQDASGLNTNMASGLGEGWADFHAMLLTVKAEDAAVASNSTWNGVYAMAGYATNDFYFGIRRVPYSTDFTKDPLTFKHISEGVALPPGVPYAFGQDGVGNSEAHNTGEVWASMLWECYASLLRDTLGPNPRISFGEARSRMKKYIVEGYKMTPTSPTLLDARDAVLAAAFATSKTDYQLFAQAFARRGAGTAAVAPDRYSPTNSPGLVESYELGGALTLVSTTLDDTLRTCTADGILDNGEAGQFLVTIKNTGARPLAGTVASITSTNPNVRFPYGNVFRMPNTNPFDEVTGGLVVGLQGATAIGQADFSITVNDPRLLSGTPATTTLSAYVNADSSAGFSTDTVESPVSAWVPQAAIGVGLFSRVQTATTPLNYAWNGPDSGSLADRSLISPNLSVGSGNFSFSFRHRYSFEFDSSNRYDGGVIEITTDGTTWTNIGTGYNGTISNCCGNPLTGRSAYTAVSSGYPAFVTQNISLGTTYANQIVKIRFRIGEDEAGGGPGWDIDNITFVGLNNKPFTGLVADAGCPTAGSN